MSRFPRIRSARSLCSRTLLTIAFALVGAAGCRTHATVSTTPTVRAVPTPPKTIVALDVPTVEGNVYRFARKGYAVAIPSGWHAQPNSSFDVSAAQFPSDTFFDPAVANGVQTSITLTCLKPREGQGTTEEFRDGWQAFLAQLLMPSKPQAIATSIAGARAYAFEYTQTVVQPSGTQRAIIGDKTDIVFVHGTCRWLVTLVAPAGSRSEHENAFMSLLNNLTFET